MFLDRGCGLKFVRSELRKQWRVGGMKCVERGGTHLGSVVSFMLEVTEAFSRKTVVKIER